MKRWILVCLLLALCANIAFAKQPTHKAVRGQKKARVQDKRAEPKEDPYKAWLVVEASTGKVLEGENIHLRWPPASITKLMLSLIVLDRLDKGGVRLQDRIVISREASKMGGSQVFLKEGETFTLEDLMKATLVASANDAAYAIGEHIAGTKEAFIDLMNERARGLGMVDTEFHSVHGLPPSGDSQEDLTSCHDLALLARELLTRHPKILEWTSIQSDPFRGGQFLMNNHNKLLLKMQGVDGLKTGYYRRSGYNIVATGTRDDLRLIVIVMGSSRSKTRDDLALEKLKKHLAQYRMVHFVKQGEPVEKEVILSGSEKLRLRGVAKTSLSYPVPESKRSTVKRVVNLPDTMKGGILEGQKIGELVVSLDNEVIGKTDIISPTSIPKASLLTRFLRMLGFE